LRNSFTGFCATFLIFGPPSLRRLAITCLPQRPVAQPHVARLILFLVPIHMVRRPARYSKVTAPLGGITRATNASAIDPKEAIAGRPVQYDG
jgi:hypothetical protein